jgi:hypothetical protein
MYALAFCILLSVTSVAAPLFLSESEGNNMILAGFESFELIEGPESPSAGDVVEMGNADEFSYMYDAEYRHLDLIWDHNPGTEIHTRSPYDPDMPDTMEFVYFKQTVEWEYNVIPLNVNITIDYGIVMTGDFSSNSLMFRVHAWLIDSSGNWVEIHASDPSYYYGHISSHVIPLNGFDIWDAWGGMIENDAGHQEDPSDELTFAIGLAPTDYFVDYYGSTPWLTYDGSLTLTIANFNAWVLLKETLPEDVIHPLENKTWGNTDRHETVMGIDVTPDGAVYTVGHEASADDPYMMAGTNLLLVKWDSQANVSWVRTVGNDSRMTIGIDVAAHGNYVYAVGYTVRNDTPTFEPDTVLLQWDLNGNEILERTYDFGDVDAAFGADTGPDGSLYVVYIAQEQISPYTMESYLSKFDSNLEMIWNVSIADSFYMIGQIIGVTNDGYVYTSTANQISKWDSEGNRVWFKNGTYRCLSVAPNGYVYAVQTPLMFGFPVEQWDPRLIVWQTDSEPITNVSLSISYGYSWEEEIVPGALATTADGNAYFWFYTTSAAGITHYLAKYDINGNQIWNRTISDDPFPISYGFTPGLMDCDSSGRIYMASTSTSHLYSENYNMDIRLLIYLDPSYSGWWFFNIPLGDVTSIALYGAAVIMIIFVVVDFTRRRRAM